MTTAEGCTFCQIAAGKSQTEFIYRDDLIAAFPDNHPVRPGHAMIISREHWPYFEDLPEATACRIVQVAQRLAAAMKELYSVPRVAFAFTGGDHAHAHAHVIPLHEKTDLTSRRYIAEPSLTFRSTPKATATELADTATALRDALSQADPLGQ